MSNLNRLAYCVTQSGYSAQVGDGVIAQELDGGAPRFKRTLKGVHHVANVKWIVKPKGYQYLMAFYRVWARNPNQPFLARLCIDGPDVEEYECYFSGSPSLGTKEGEIYTVTATLRVKPLNIDSNIDDLLVGAGNEDIDLYELWNPFEKLVNDTLPKALEDL